jgi:hypothetical protein
MANRILRTVGLSSAIAATVVCGAFSSQVFAMSPFEANYQFNYNGKNLGSAKRALTKSGNNWSYVFSAKAGAMASATETSRFTFNNGVIGSSAFSRTSKVLTHSNTMSISFNPSAKTVSTKKDDKSRSFAWKSGVLDELNAELQVREDLKKGALKGSYSIADAKEIESRKFVKQGNEKIKTNLGTIDTVKVVMKHDKPGRETIFWLAPSYDYLPVKVTHVDQKTSYGLLLTSYKGTKS